MSEIGTPSQLLLRLDDRNPLISYFSPLDSGETSDWSYNGSRSEFNHTVSRATNVGAGASIAFSGTSIAVFGTISQESFEKPNPITQYTLDAKTAVTYHAQASIEVQYGVQFYRSPNLTYGHHTLEIMITGAGNLWLDYLEITGNPPVALPGGDSSSPSSINATQAITSNRSQPSSRPSDAAGGNSPVSGAAAQATTSNETQPPTPGSSATGSDPRSGVPTGTILGGHLGLIILFLLVWYIRRKLSRKRLEARDATLPSASSALSHPQIRPSGPQSVVPFRLSAPTIPSLAGASSGIEGASSGTSTANVGGTAAPVHKRQTLVSQPQDDPPPRYHDPEVGGS